MAACRVRAGKAERVDRRPISMTAWTMNPTLSSTVVTVLPVS